MLANKELFEKYLNPVFIESGSLYGDGIQSAIEAGFKEIYSIELAQPYYDHCVERFKNVSYVYIILGDSHLVLGELLSKIDRQITFWLDGHFCGGDSGFGKYESPLVQELEIIKTHPIKTHTILVDDLRCWKKETHGFDTATITAKLLEINPNYSLVFRDGTAPMDILIAVM